MAWTSEIARYINTHWRTRLLFNFITLATFMIVIAAAPDGHRPPGHLIVFAAVMTLVMTWMTVRDSFGLTESDRALLWDARMLGQPTGDLKLDALAARQLDNAIRHRNAFIAFRVGIGLLVVGLPIMVAVRSGNAWWLCTLLASVVYANEVLPEVSAGPAEIRLRRLTEQMSDGQPS